MSKTQKLIAGSIIAITVILAISSSWGDSTIVDEIPHIGAGYSYLVKNDYRLNAEHPPLVKDLAGIPLLFLNLDQQAFETKPWLSDLNGQWEFGRNLIYESGNDATLVTNTARLPMILFFIASALLIFIWAYELYGWLAAFIALIIFSFSSTVLAHSRLVTTDAAALWAILYSTYFFLKYLKKQTHKNFWLASLFFGLALIAKFSTILLVPFFGITALVYGAFHTQHHARLMAVIYSGFKSVLVMAVGFIIIVWPVYYLHTYKYPPERQYRDTQLILQTFGKRYMADPVVWASDKPVLRAAGQYALGLLMVTQRSAGGNTTYFLGEVSRFGWHHYFPIVYFMKEPLAWWALIIIALLFLGTQLKRPSPDTPQRLLEFMKNNFIEFSMLLWLAIYWAFSINSTLNIGVRHLLPVYPFTIILVAGLLVRLILKAKQFSRKYYLVSVSILAILLGWYVLENLRVYPFYMTYFNQTVGGPSGGYQYVVDSNLDWGQDLRRLADWVKQNNITRIETDYFGWADPVYYMGSTYEQLWSAKYVDAQDFKSKNTTDGWMAVSATFLQGSEGPSDMPRSINYLWLKSFTPVTTIGNSIFIFRIK